MSGKNLMPETQGVKPKETAQAIVSARSRVCGGDSLLFQPKTGRILAPRLSQTMTRRSS
jgi:hypothetical protein